jgi:hypothetical protein
MPSANSVEGFTKRRSSGKVWTDQAGIDPQQIAEHFADQVYATAIDPRGSAKIWRVILGIPRLVSCVLLICGASIMLSAGSIVV